MPKARRPTTARTRSKTGRLTLDLKGPKVTKDQFKQAVDAFLALIDDLSAKLPGGSSEDIRWIITVEPGSVSLNADPEALRPRAQPLKVTRTLATGIRTLDRRAHRPQHFSDRALRRVHALATVSDGHDVTSTHVRAEGRDVELSPRAVDNVETLLGSAVADYGSIEGTLQTISVRGGLHVRVYDSLSDKPVRCLVEESHMPEVIRALGKRVSVSGVIRYRRNGDPTSIKVDQIEEFPDESELPTADEVYGILSQ